VTLSREKMREYMRERRKRERLELETLRERIAELETGKPPIVMDVDSLVDRVIAEKEARLKG
jgi:hypothetical protein